MLDRRHFLGAMAASSLVSCGGSEPEPEAEAPAEPEYDHLVYFGTYTRGDVSKGIYVSRFSSMTGEVSDPELAAELVNPSFVCFHPNGQNLYAVSETDDGTVVAYQIDRTTGKLTQLDTQPTQGGSPCDLQVDSSGQMLAVANYGGGSTISYRVGANGSISAPTHFEQHEGSSVHPRQKAPHAHSIEYSPDNRFLFVCDLGKDQVLRYTIDATEATFAPSGAADLPPGSGPRHMAFHPSGKLCFTVNEIASTVSSFKYEAESGAMTIVETVSTLPDGSTVENNTTAEIRVHPNGRYLYASNRGHNSLALFSIDETTGAIERKANFLTEGKTPRCFAIAPGGRYLLAANQDSNDVVAFEVNESTGELTATGRKLSVGMPVCVDYLAL
ncbi:MAG: lactonase family protein [Bryobacterales bacterium]